jgi:anti-repressor protein
MNELIQVNYDNDRPTVLARDLHEFLEVKTAFKDWFPRMCEYGFSEGIDYCSFLSNRSDGLPGKPKQDAQLTIEMAKEICMLQRNERGKQARQYFIQLEKDWNSPELVMARALKMANSRIGSLEERTVHLEQKIEKDKPKVLFADAVSVSGSAILIGDLAKILRQNGVEMGPNRLFQWLRENGYLIKQKGSSYNMPTQKSMELGLFKIKETCVTHSDGHTSINRTPKVTGKGQVYLLNKILGRKVEQIELEEKAE